MLPESTSFQMYKIKTTSIVNIKSITSPLLSQIGGMFYLILYYMRLDEANLIDLLFYLNILSQIHDFSELIILFDFHPN